MSQIGSTIGGNVSPGRSARPLFFRNSIQNLLLLLDLYPGAAAAYSLQKIRSDYTGPVVRVRRSSDGSEQDFTTSEVGDGTLSTWLGGADPFVSVVYDQTTNGRDVDQDTQFQQPRMRQDIQGRWYVDQNALTVGGYQPTSYVECYSLPSIGGTSIPSQGASGDYTVDRPFESWIVYPDTMSTSDRKDVALKLEAEAMSFSSGTITSLKDHFRNLEVQLTDSAGVDRWDTSQVTNMQWLFRNSPVSDLSPLSGWDVSSVTNMRGLFQFTSVSDLLPISGWDVSSVTNMRALIRLSFVSDLSPISGWDVGALTSATSFADGAFTNSVPVGDMLAGWTDGSPNSATDLQSGVTIGIPNADYTQMDAGGQGAVDALCADPPNWTVNVANAPADCS